MWDMPTHEVPCVFVCLLLDNKQQSALISTRKKQTLAEFSPAHEKLKLLRAGKRTPYSEQLPDKLKNVHREVRII